jgi:hypothetical protein
MPGISRVCAEMLGACIKIIFANLAEDFAVVPGIS